VGKTDLALRLARLLGGEIVSIDSRQVYRRLDAGTAKPNGRWLDGAYRVDGIPYHLVDFLDPTETFDAARFARLAEEAIERIQAAGRVPILAGGSGMYLQALFNGLDPLPPRSESVRAALDSELAEKGISAVVKRLRAADPAGADWAGTNPRRLIRALEVLELTGRPISMQWSGAFLRDLPPERAVYIGLDVGREELDRRIDERSRATWPSMQSEAEALLAEGLPRTAPGLRVLGYPEAVSVVLGEKPEAQARAELVRATQKYAKRQRTWFRRYKRLRWETPGPALEERLAEDYRRTTWKE
jgi:tRNA dimethylallyltransferase